MKRYLLFIFSLFISFYAFSQIESAGIPLKFALEKQTLRRSATNFFVDLNADTTKIASESSQRVLVSGVTCPVDISIKECQ